MAFKLTLWQHNYVLKKRMYLEADLAALAKKFRKESGKTKAEVGRKLGVTRPTMQDAEERPEKNLTKLRIRIIKSCSKHYVAGPFYFLKPNAIKR